MMRLAVIGAEESRWHVITSRLRGVMVDVAPSHDSVSTCDAALFLKAPRVNDPGIERFLHAGKHVLVLPDTWLLKERLQSLADAARQTQATFAITNPERYLPSRRLIRQQLETGKLGEPGLIRLHRWNQGADADALLCDLDLVLWYFGRTPSLVYAVERECTLVHLGFPGGGMALIDHAHQFPAGDGYCSLSVIASRGAAHADDHQNTQLLYGGGNPRAIRSDEGVVQWSMLVQEFADRIAGAVPSDAESNLAWQQVLSVAEAVRQSLQTKRAVVPGGAT